MIPETLTPAERMILINQFRILKSFENSENKEIPIDTLDNYITILERGYSGLYKEIFNYLYPEEEPEITKEIYEILTLNRQIQITINKLSEEDKNTLNLEVLEFKGFDASHDPHYDQAKFMIDDMGLYMEFKDKSLKSHSKLNIQKYRRIIAAYEKLEKHGAPPTRDELVILIDAAGN